MSYWDVLAITMPDFQEWLTERDQKVRRAVMAEAADEVHVEARFQLMEQRRGKSDRDYLIDRLAVLEQIFNDRAGNPRKTVFAAPTPQT